MSPDGELFALERFNSPDEDVGILAFVQYSVALVQWPEARRWFALFGVASGMLSVRQSSVLMALLINAYCTHRDPPSLDFPHDFNNRRDRSDPELLDHLNGFVGYILNNGEREMTQSLYHVMRHIERVQHHLSLEVDDHQLDAFSQWAWQANAICFLPDGTVRDPSGGILVDPQDGTLAEGAEIPYPPDAHQRKARSDERLRKLAIQVPATLPPVISEVEVVLRTPTEVAQRTLALFAVALRAESLASGNQLAVPELQQRFPLAFDAISPGEDAFLKAASPEHQQIINCAWRYEAVFLLQWALGLVDELPLPTTICDVRDVARIMVDTTGDDLVAEAKLRPAEEILDALDLHYRLHWAVRQARLEKRDPPANLDAGVISERHYALNWLVRFEDADWDDVDTPT